MHEALLFIRYTFLLSWVRCFKSKQRASLQAHSDLCQMETSKGHRICCALFVSDVVLWNKATPLKSRNICAYPPYRLFYEPTKASVKQIEWTLWKDAIVICWKLGTFDGIMVACSLL